MGLALDYIWGQTPLDEDEVDGIVPSSITTKGELNEFEQQNIEEAIQWVLLRSFKQQQVFTEAFVKDLHKRMYGDVWKWAGQFRKTNKNIGVDKWSIGSELKCLLDDAVYWVENNVYAPDEIAIRFKHRIVSIHCFPNGNGRHSRLMADIIIEKIFKLPVFTWGAGSLVQNGDARSNYLKAVKAADAGNFELLMAFARS